MAQGGGLISNLFWKFAERITAQLVTTVVTIILARILEPSHYGIISIVTIFISIANVFVSDGLGSALIQKKDADALDFTSILYFNVLLSVVLYCVLFLVAPIITSFYGNGYEILTPVLRVLSFRLILSAINSVQQAYISKKMIFKKFFWATLLGTVLSAVVGIVLALKGFGVWALVAQYLTNTTVDTIVLGLSLQKKPLLQFSWKRVKDLVGYGSRILGTNLLITGYQELRALIIGKVYSSSDLAYYDQGRKYPNLIVANINTSIGAVLFPKLSDEQDDIKKIKATTRNSIRFSAFIMCPMMLGLAVVAEPFVKLVLTDKWLPCVPLLQMFCIIYLFQPIHTANMQAIKAMGRSDVYLKLEIIKKIIELVVLIFTMFISVNAIAVGMAIMTTAFTFINAYPNIRLLNYGFKEQMIDIAPTIVKSLGMAIIVYLVGKLNLEPFPLLCIQVITGILIYVGLCRLTNCYELSYVLLSIKQHLQHIRGN